MALTPSGFVAVLAGWFVTEIGRQPWIVQGLMRTAEAVSETLEPGQVLLSLILFTVIYLALFAVFIVLLDQKIRKGPLDVDAEVGPVRYKEAER